MAKSRSRCLAEKSIAAMISAIEIYNKPDFQYREETYAILAINAWELLLKSRILQLSKNRLSSIIKYERRQNQDGSISTRKYIVTNRSGNPVSIGLFKAYDDLINEYGDKLDPVIRKNIEALIEVRDNSVHFINDDFGLSKKIQEIGTANVKNFVRLVKRWFAIDLSKYNFYLMPLAFVRESSHGEAIPLNLHERKLLKYFQSQEFKGDDETKDFNYSLDLEIRFKRVSDDTGTIVRISNEPDALPVCITEENVRDTYPWSYDVLTTRLSKRYSDFKVNQKFHNIRKPLTEDSRFCNIRYLDPDNPDGTKKYFFNPNIVREFDKYYKRKS